MELFSKNGEQNNKQKTIRKTKGRSRRTNMQITGVPKYENI